MPQSLTLSTPPPEAGDLIDIADITHALPQHHADGIHDGNHGHEAHDWTLDLPDSEHVRFFRATDWTRSRLGPLKEWSPTLRLFTRMLFADSRAACLWWSVTISMDLGRQKGSNG